jgi:hypothetical protein
MLLITSTNDPTVSANVFWLVSNASNSSVTLIFPVACMFPNFSIFAVNLSTVLCRFDTVSVSVATVVSSSIDRAVLFDVQIIDKLLIQMPLLVL